MGPFHLVAQLVWGTSTASLIFLGKSLSLADLGPLTVSPALKDVSPARLLRGQTVLNLNKPIPENCSAAFPCLRSHVYSQKYAETSERGAPTHSFPEQGQT